MRKSGNQIFSGNLQILLIIKGNLIQEMYFMKWLPVKNYEGYYEVSESGEVRSVERVLSVTKQPSRKLKGKILYQTTNVQVGYRQVSLWKNNIGTSLYVHRLLAEAFIPNPQNKPEVNHIDGNRQNNHISNLEWVTSGENSLHASQSGLRVYTNRLTKDEFLECLYDVINGESYQSLSERVPYKVSFLSTKLRALAKEVGLESELNESLYNQRVLRARVNGNPLLRKSK